MYLTCILNKMGSPYLIVNISDGINLNDSLIDFCKAVKCKPVTLSANLAIK